MKDPENTENSEKNIRKSKISMQWTVIRTCDKFIW